MRLYYSPDEGGGTAGAPVETGGEAPAPTGLTDTGASASPAAAEPVDGQPAATPAQPPNPATPIPPKVEVPIVDGKVEGISEEAAAAWNGEVDSLRDQTWFQELTGPAQQKVLDGLRTKYLNLERGVHTKFQANSARARELDAREARAKADEERARRWLHGESDPVDDLRAELAEAKTQSEAALAALRTELEANYTEQLTAKGTELEALKAERDELHARVEAIEAAEQAAREAEEAAAAEELGQQIETHIPGIMEDPELEEAFVTLMGMLKLGRPLEAAVRATRAAHPELAERQAAQAAAEEAAKPPEPPQPDPVPSALELMSLDGGTHGNALQVNGSPKSAEDALAEMYRGTGVALTP